MYHQPVNGVSAFVLAGGHSSRMGKDKAFLELAGRTLLSRAMELAGSVAGEVHVVAEMKKFMTICPVIEDVYPGQGPLAGIHAGLLRSTTALNLMLAVDLPFVEADFLRYLLSEASRTSAVVTVPRAAGGLQPLCAVYRREFAEFAERSLRKEKNRVDSLFTQVETRIISEEELERIGFVRTMFRNLNTPKEFEQAELEMGRPKASGE